MKLVTKFIADDGREFSIEEECDKYECDDMPFNQIADMADGCITKEIALDKEQFIKRLKKAFCVQPRTPVGK
jgi:hypothetical protein